ncbi:MAG TPA: hypothetical protein VLT90_07885 [Terriglobales bacterium]|nr:hypothetical protein [Terriglobales bacterium]
MLGKLREVLLTQYIGAFLIALLVWQGAIDIISQIIRSGYWAFYTRRASVYGDYSRQQYRWDNLAITIVSVALYLLVAYGLARWLYPQLAPKTTDEPEAPFGDAPEQP